MRDQPSRRRLGRAGPDRLVRALAQSVRTGATRSRTRLRRGDHAGRGLPGRRPGRAGPGPEPASPGDSSGQYRRAHASGGESARRCRRGCPGPAHRSEPRRLAYGAERPCGCATRSPTTTVPPGGWARSGLYVNAWLHRRGGSGPQPQASSTLLYDLTTRSWCPPAHRSRRAERGAAAGDPFGARGPRPAPSPTPRRRWACRRSAASPSAPVTTRRGGGARER